MSDVVLTNEDIQLFDEFYQRRLAEAGGARDDFEELAVARDISQAVVSDGLTPTPDGGVSYVRRQGAMDWTDPATVQAAAQVSGNGRGRARMAATGRKASANPKDMLTGVAMIVVALAAVLYFIGPKVMGKGKTKVTATPETTVVVEAADATPTPLPTLESELLADIVDASGVKTDLVVPRTLEIKGVSFVVQPVKIQAGDWPLPDDERAVSWVYGTVVNYVLGLEATPDNKALLASLRAGDELLLRMSTGPAYRFAFADAVRVAPQASEVFRQTRPGLTLALLGEAEQASRVVIRAVYIPDSELAEGGIGPLAQRVEAGRPVTLDEALRLTFLGATPFVTAATPPGYVYLAVDHVVENVLSSEALPTTVFVHQVMDGNGLAYPSASPVGGVPDRYRPLPAEVEAGQVMTTTAVYAVPEDALSEGLAWRFAPSPSGTMVQAQIPPYAGLLEPQVASREAMRLPDGSLAVTFNLSASGLRDVQVTADDVQVQGGILKWEDNRFPWQVPAGASSDFRLSLIPDEQVVTIALLGQGFEVSME
jgi:hypothetical protein